MCNISRKQYRVLKHIYRRKSINSSQLSDERIEICNYLTECNYLSIQPLSIVLDSPLCSDYLLRVTQSGEAEIYRFRSTFYKWWIPVVISVFALLVSIASLLSQLM